METWRTKLSIVRCLVAGLVLGLLSGCASTTFVYRPGPAMDGPRLPLKLAVLAFNDGTADFMSQGSILIPETMSYNLAKGGIPGQISALTPELWAKAFAEDLRAAGSFRSVRFVYSPTELTDEDYYVDGTLARAEKYNSFATPSEYVLDLRALRRADKKPIWEKKVSRSWKVPNTLYDGCSGFAVQCMVDRHHADTNKAMQGIFTEARVDLVKTLASLPGGRAGEDGSSPAASPAPPPDAESVDETIEGILKGK